MEEQSHKQPSNSQYQHIVSFDIGEKNLSIFQFKYDRNNNIIRVQKWFTQNIYCCSFCDQPLQQNDGIFSCKSGECIQSQIQKGIYQQIHKQTSTQTNIQIVQYLLFFLKQNFECHDQMKDFQVVIEDQPHNKKMNRKMIYIQDAIVSYFTYKGADVYCYQARERSIFYENSDYRQNKKNSVLCTQSILEKNKKQKYFEYFINYGKKDDLSDCFLQGLCFIYKNILKINMSKKKKQEKHDDFFNSLQLL